MTTYVPYTQVNFFGNCNCCYPPVLARSSSGSGSSGSGPSCCRNCLRLVVPQISFHGDPAFVIPDYVTMQAGRYAWMPVYDDGCARYVTDPTYYGLLGNTEDGRLAFGAENVAGVWTLTAQFAYSGYGSGGGATWSTAIYTSTDATCDSVGNYTFQSVSYTVPSYVTVSEPFVVEWPSSLQVVDQSAATTPSGPPSTIILTLPSCRNTYCPATLSLPLIAADTVVDSYGTVIGLQWELDFSISALGTITTRVTVNCVCGYIYMSFRDLEVGGSPLGDGNGPVPMANGGTVDIANVSCLGISDSGVFGSGCCPTAPVIVSW